MGKEESAGEGSWKGERRIVRSTAMRIIVLIIRGEERQGSSKTGVGFFFPQT